MNHCNIQPDISPTSPRVSFFFFDGFGSWNPGSGSHACPAPTILFYQDVMTRPLEVYLKISFRFMFEDVIVKDSSKNIIVGQ